MDASWYDGSILIQEGSICKCKQVSYLDVENALHEMTRFEDVLQAFDEVQKIDLLYGPQRRCGRF